MKGSFRFLGPSRVSRSIYNISRESHPFGNLVCGKHPPWPFYGFVTFNFFQWLDLVPVRAGRVERVQPDWPKFLPSSASRTLSTFFRVLTPY